MSDYRWRVQEIRAISCTQYSPDVILLLLILLELEKISPCQWVPLADVRLYAESLAAAGRKRSLSIVSSQIAKVKRVS